MKRFNELRKNKPLMLTWCIIFWAVFSFQTINTINQAYYTTITVESGITLTDGDLDMSGTATNHLILPLNDDAATPTISLGATNAGFFAQDANTHWWAADGAAKIKFDANNFSSGTTGSFFMRNSAGDTTTPVYSYRDDADTGMSRSAADQQSFQVGAVEALRMLEDTTITITAYGLFDYGTAAGITASVTQSQGQQPLTNSINEIATCANANDVVTMPAAAAGRRVVLINNGAQTLQIFPASGDDLGAGVDTSVTLASGSNVEFVAYDATNWEQL
jgi:hypothetical protein